MHYKYLFKARGKTTKGEKNRKREKEGMHGKIGILWYDDVSKYRTLFQHGSN